MSRKRGGLALLALGLVVAIGVAWMTFSQAQRAAQIARMESVDVLVAAQDIPERTVVTAPFLSVKRMLPASLPPNALKSADQVVGKMTTGPIYAGEFILPGKLVGADGRAGITYTVPKGKVVMTMPASDILTTGAVKPGDTVDLLVTIKPPDKERASSTPSKNTTTGEAGATRTTAAQAVPADPNNAAKDDLDLATTQTTMQNLKVISIGPVGVPGAEPAKTDSGAKPAANANVITFAVDHEDALILKALKDSDRAKLEMVLRAAGDDAAAVTEPVTIANILDRYGFRAVPTPRAMN